VRESKHKRQRERKWPGSGSARFPEVLQVEERKERSYVLFSEEDRLQKIVPSSAAPEEDHRTTTARLYAPPEAAGSRRDFMFTNFSKSGNDNDAPETAEIESAGGDDKLHGIGASEMSELQKYPTPWRDAPRRAALRFRVALAVYDESGKGGNAATPRGDFIDHTIDGTRVSAVRLLPRQRVGGKADEGTTKLSASRCRVTSSCFPRNCHEIARHESPSLAACFFPCNLSIQHTLSDILRTLLRCSENT